MKILFMGSPPLAAATLTVLRSSPHEICGVFTREKKPVGRKKILTPTAVGALAEELGYELFTPRTLKDESIEDTIRNLAPDIIAVVAYGRILPKNILDIPRYGAVNLHVSLLPKYRGAAPIQRALMAGEKETGVTVMRLDEGVDTGDIISFESFEIALNDNAAAIFERVETVGIPLFLKALDDIENGTATFTPQEHDSATLAPPILKEELFCDFSQSATDIHNLARGVYDFLTAKIEICGVICGLCETLPVEVDEKAKIGEVLDTNPLTIKCAQGAIKIENLRPEGKNIMSGTAFALGRRIKVGDTCICVNSHE